MPESINEIKSIGSYKVKFKASFDVESEDKIFLSIQLTDDVKKILQDAKSSINTTLVEFTYNDGSTYVPLKRYRVKDWINSSLYNDYKDILFTKTLVDTGELKLPFTSISRIESFITAMKENFRRLIETMLKATRIDQTINYNPAR